LDAAEEDQAWAKCELRRVSMVSNISQESGILLVC